MDDQEVTKFEPLIESLGKIISRIEDEQSDLESSLTAYEEGIRLVRQARQYLEQAEQRVSVLEEKLTSRDETEED